MSEVGWIGGFVELPEASLEAVEPRMQAAIVDVGAGQHTRAHISSRWSRGCSGALHVGQPGGDHLRSSGQLASAQRRGLGVRRSA